jgi:hypothetical protein
MKLSDRKFINQSLEKALPKKAAALEATDFSALRGIGNRHERNAFVPLPSVGGQYEPVSFAHPEQARRVYGWLVAVDPAGNARVEIGDGEYAIVPPSELRRIGETEDRQKIQARLKRVLAKTDFAALVIRTDMKETMSPTMLDDGSGTELLSLRYSAAYGEPSHDEVTAYVSRFHPTATIVGVDTGFPGRLSVAVKHVDAEMEGAVGGEVTEVLDPSEVVASDDVEAVHEVTAVDIHMDDVEAACGVDADFRKTAPPAAKKASVQKEAIWPWPSTNTLDRTADPYELAEGLVSGKHPGLAQKVLKVYFANDGAHSLLAHQGRFTTTELLAAAMPVVQRANPPLYRSIVSATVAGQVTGPVSKPEQPTAPAQPEQPTAPAQPAQPTTSAQPTQPTAQPAQPAEFSPGQPSDISMPVDAPTEPAWVDQTQDLDAGSTTDMSKQVTEDLREQVTEDIKEKLMGDDGGPKHIGPKTSAKRTSMFETSTPSATDGVKRASFFDAKSLAEMPKTMSEVTASFSMDNIGRRGDYTVARVSWDPKVLEGKTDSAVKQAVVTFVKSMAGSNRQGADFGIIGKVYVRALNTQKGTATAQFASTSEGPATKMVVEQED